MCTFSATEEFILLFVVGMLLAFAISYISSI